MSKEKTNSANACCYCNREIAIESQCCGVCVRERNKLDLNSKQPIIETKIENGRTFQRIRIGEMVSEWSLDIDIRFKKLKKI